MPFEAIQDVDDVLELFRNRLDQLDCSSRVLQDLLQVLSGESVKELSHSRVVSMTYFVRVIGALTLGQEACICMLINGLNQILVNCVYSKLACGKY